MVSLNYSGQQKSSDSNKSVQCALTLVGFSLWDLIFLANHSNMDRWNSRECMGVEIEPFTSEVDQNVSC
jgi:hypothetical protein